MIATALIGGLGNQMFQYAAGRALALRLGSRLVLDLSSFGRVHTGTVPRSFELDRLAVQATPATHLEGMTLLLARRPNRLVRGVSGWRTLREASLSYDPAVTVARDDTYLIGYWQSWRYLEDHAAAIAADLQPRSPLSARNIAIQDRMRSSPSLSLHVRRGDYLHAEHAAHGVLDRDFYLDAVARVCAAAPALDLYVFSDDLDWCRDAFDSTDWRPTYVDWNRGEDSWQDLFLMSACRHAVVANSSFSWWGAWLGDQHPAADSRIVVAPGRWFAGGDTSMADRCPPSWIRI